MKSGLIQKILLLYPSCVLLFSTCALLAQSDLPADDYFRLSHHEVVLMGQEVNSPGPDLSPFRYASKLYFTTSGWEGKAGGSRLFTYLQNGATVAVPFNPEPGDKDRILDAMLTNTGKRIYYTLGHINEKGEVEKSRIVFRDKDFNGRWSPMKHLPPALNSKGTNMANPAPGIFRDNRAEVLFFTSDRPGGAGRKDIWMTSAENGVFSPPVRLPFNTEEDEATPFFDIAGQTLYFSSKGHNAIGGFDVFRSHYLGNGQWSAPQRLGQPVNSPFDDLYFTFNKNTGYLTSDRPNKTCPDDKPNCRDFDIYKINLLATLQVFLFESNGMEPLYNCTVELKDTGSGRIISTYMNLENNYTSVGLRPGVDYQLIVSKKGYFPVFKNINADGMDFFKAGFIELTLQPMTRPQHTAPDNDNITSQLRMPHPPPSSPPPPERQESSAAATDQKGGKGEPPIPPATESKPAQPAFYARFQQLLLNMDTTNWMQITHIPQMASKVNNDTMDFLFYHKKLDCLIAFDLRYKNFQPDDTEAMDHYLSAVNGIINKNQQPAIGISVFIGSENHFIIYTFPDGNINTKKPSFIHTFLFPRHYKGVLPDPSAIVKLLDDE